MKMVLKFILGLLREYGICFRMFLVGWLDGELLGMWLRFLMMC